MKKEKPHKSQPFFGNAVLIVKNYTVVDDGLEPHQTKLGKQRYTFLHQIYIGVRKPALGGSIKTILCNIP